MGAFLRILFSEFWAEVIRPLGLLLISKAGKDLWNSTTGVVNGVEADMPDAEGKDKFVEAFNRLTQDLEAKGKEYPTWIKNLFIELAVAWLKKYVPFI